MPDIVEALDESYLGISSFYIEKSGMTSWTGTKAQPLPAAGWENKFRFESGNNARGYIYYQVEIDGESERKDLWIEKEMTLNSALSNLSSLTAATALSLFVASLA